MYQYLCMLKVDCSGILKIAEKNHIILKWFPTIIAEF